MAELMVRLAKENMTKEPAKSLLKDFKIEY